MFRNHFPKLINVMKNSIMKVSCAKGFYDKTPLFMENRQNVINVINNVYEKHCIEKIETPIFELKEIFSNKKFPSKNILELDDQGGSILALRADLKYPLLRNLSAKKEESHRRIAQNGCIYAKNFNSLINATFREKFVSDVDICGPIDPMLTEIQCIRIICDILHDLKIDDYKIILNHRKLIESLLRLSINSILSINIPETQSIKLIQKLIDNHLNNKIDFINALKILNDKKLNQQIIDKFEELCDKYSGPYNKVINDLINYEELNNLKEVKTLSNDFEKLKEYIDYFIVKNDRGKIEFSSNIIGCHSYYTGLLFNVFIDNNKLALINGGRYENLINRFNNNYKDKLNLTGFTINIDDFVILELINKGLKNDDIIKITDDDNNDGDIDDVKKQVDNVKIKEKFNVGNIEFLLPPKGSIDRVGDQIIARESVFGTIINCFKRYNADTIDTPVVERKDILTGKYGEDSKLIYDLDDVDGEKLSLRYDLTVPFARYLVMHPEAVEGGKLFKRYQIGRVYRRDNPSISTGRYREFYQCDFDIAGKYDDLMKPDFECLSIVYEILNELNLGEFRIKVNHRKLLDGLFAVCGVPAELFKTICSSVDKLDKTPWDVVKKEMLCKGISEETADHIGKYVEMNGGLELIDKLESDENLIANENIRLALNEMRILLNFCEEASKMDRISFDLSLARGLDYYTGMIFEAIITEKLTVSEGDAKEERVGSVSGGGRYDNLVAMFSENDENLVPCVGLSLGVERLMAIYQRKKEFLQQQGIEKEGKLGNIYNKSVMVISASEKKCPLESPEGERMKIMSMLLNAGIKCLHSMKRNPKTLNMFQECEECGIPFQVVIGRDELSRGVVQVRDTKMRESKEVKIEELIETLKKLL